MTSLRMFDPVGNFQEIFFLREYMLTEYLKIQNLQKKGVRARFPDDLTIFNPLIFWCQRSKGIETQKR